MIEHLEHEVSMLRGGHAEFLRHNQPDYKKFDRADTVRVVRTSFFEVTLLHARLLDEFLTWGKGKSGDDIWAGDYIPDWDGSIGPLDKVPSLSKQSLTVRATLNKQLAHVSTARALQASFYVDVVVREVVDRMRDFAVAPTNLNHSGFARLRELVGPAWPPPMPSPPA